MNDTEIGQALGTAEPQVNTDGHGALTDDARLPTGIAYVPSASGLQVGGDWYDAFAVAEDRIALAAGARRRRRRGDRRERAHALGHRRLRVEDL